jgi:universal stress protein A
MAIQKILCAIDFSSHSRDALREAAEWARAAQGSLTLIHVIDPPRYLFLDGFLAYSTFIEQARAHADEQLATWIEETRGPAAPAPVASIVAEGAAWAAIVDAARDGNYDLVVVGTEGRTGLSRALLGSVAERVVRHAHCPVLVVRRGAPA